MRRPAGRHDRLQLRRCITLYPSMLGEIAVPAAVDCPRKQLDPNQIMNLEKIWNRQPQATTAERLFNFTVIAQVL